MPGPTKRMSHKAGLPPGSLVHIGRRKVEQTRITIIDYDEKRVQEKEAKTVEECFPFKDQPTVTWVNIDGIHDMDIIEKVGKHFGIHPLVLEDIVNTGQRPKVEDFENYLFFVVKMLTYEENDKKGSINSEQVSILVGPHFVISFQERQGDVFEAIRDRLRNDKGRIRKEGSDYLAYALIDAIVDGYFIVLENLGDRIEGLEDAVIEDPSSQTLQKINGLKREMITLRRSVWPLREVIGSLERGGSSLIQPTTMTYLRDLYDHTVQVADTIETYRDMVAGTRDTYLSSVSNRMNEIMKVLTIIATIFIPVTFIAGVYGMNFKFMPELAWRGSYFVVLGVMAAVALVMIAYFKKKDWL
jgi:magnesium transporter